MSNKHCKYEGNMVTPDRMAYKGPWVQPVKLQTKVSLMEDGSGPARLLRVALWAS